MEISAAVSRDTHAPPQIESVEIDAPRADEVLVRILSCGICHTDLFAAQRFPLPGVLGHEGAGIVEQVGSAVSKVKRGDRVAMTFGSCGHCRLCIEGSPACCEHGHDLQFGGSRADGSKTLRGSGGAISGSFFQQSSFASYALGTERSVVRLPEGMPIELAGPFGCGIQTGAGAVLNNLKVTAGSSVAIFGTGAVGLAAVMAARLAGAAKIIAIDINPSRLQLALELGATHVLDARDGDVVARIRAIERRGVMYSLDTAAQISTINDALECLVRKGVCAIVSVPLMGKPYPMSLLPVLTGGKTLIGVLEGDSVPDVFIPMLCELYLAGRLPIDRLVAFYSFGDIDAAFADAEQGRTVKPILRMT
jgi:aryl-alcohol dehydrogenase